MNNLSLKKTKPITLSAKIGFLFYRLRHVFGNKNLQTSFESLNTPDFTPIAPKINIVYSGFNQLLAVIVNIPTYIISKFFSLMEFMYPFESDKLPSRLAHRKYFDIKSALKKIFSRIGHYILELSESIHIFIFGTHQVESPRILNRVLPVLKNKFLLLFVITVCYLLGRGVVSLSPMHIFIFSMLPLVISLVVINPLIGLIAYTYLALSVAQFSMWDFPKAILGMPFF